MSDMSFQEIVKVGQNKAIVLCRAATDSGEKFFHYIIADLASIKQMHRDFSEKKEVDFSAYGEIVHSGWGENPGVDDERIISDKFPKNVIESVD